MNDTERFRKAVGDYVISGLYGLSQALPFFTYTRVSDDRIEVRLKEGDRDVKAATEFFSGWIYGKGMDALQVVALEHGEIVAIVMVGSN